MAWRRVGLMLCAALAGGLTALAPLEQAVQAGYAQLEEAGAWLRQLSLSGAGGNVLAWALVLLVSCLPLLLLVLPRGRGRWHGEDLLLPGCALLFLVLAFCLVNPTWQPSPIFPEVWMLAAFGIWGMGLVSWLVLHLLRGLEEGTIEKVSAVLRVLLVGCAALLVFAAALHGSRAVAAAVDGPAPEQIAMGQLITGGPFDRVMSSGSLWLTAVLALAELVPSLWLTAVLALAELVPKLLAAWVLLLAADLTDALALGPFSGESAARCAATARRCRLAIQLTLALALGGNLVKLALVGVIPQVQFSLDLPLLPLTLAAALYLLCRCIQRGKELQEDNDSII